MTRSKQIHIFKRKSGKFTDTKEHGTKEIKYDIELGIDKVK